MTNILKSLIFLTTAVLTYSTANTSSTGAAGRNINPIFFEEITEDFEEERKAKEILKADRLTKMNDNHEDYTSFVAQAVESIENFTDYSVERQNQITDWVTEKYLEPKIIDPKLLRYSMDNCVFAKTPTMCMECINGWGPYPITD